MLLDGCNHTLGIGVMLSNVLEHALMRLVLNMGYHRGQFSAQSVLFSM